MTVDQVTETAVVADERLRRRRYRRTLVMEMAR
jgi:hypothetical protein